MPGSRRVIVKARIVRHKGARFRAAPLVRHLDYLGREGVTRDGSEAGLFNAASDAVDREVFARRCEEDRHHFRFIVGPEDAGEMSDLRGFTRELMADMARDLETRLEWVAVDHWNTDNPHVHILVRGRVDAGGDLVIDGDYIAQGIRGRAEERVTLELGLRSEREIRLAREREIEVDGWTGLDRQLVGMADAQVGQIDLRPGVDGTSVERQLLVGRAAKLARLGLAVQEEPGLWTVSPEAESVLRALADRGDIIRTMHRAMTHEGAGIDPGRFALHGDAPLRRVIGRLVERGLHDALAGTAYAIVDGADGQIHHLRFDDLGQTGDARPGAIVELGRQRDAGGRTRAVLMTRSDLTLAQQVHADGATWLDGQLVTPVSVATGHGFGAEIREALAQRGDHLVQDGLARRYGDGLRCAPDLVSRLQEREMSRQIAAIAARGMTHSPSSEGEHVSGIYRERLTLSSGRFALIETVRDDGALGFQLVPWRPPLDARLGQQVGGVMGRSGQIDWMIGRGHGLGV